METVKIAAVGDIMMWKPQIETARRSGDRFSFNGMFAEISPFIKGADLAIGNLETVFAGREEQYQRRDPRTHYPMFNCPDELAKALRDAGFKVLTTANNHCLDRGSKGLSRTLDILDQQGIKHTGTYRSADDADRDLILEVKGIKIGILAYTYGTNVKVPSKEPWRVNLIDDTMLQRIRNLKKKVDLTIICLHFGEEFYLRTVSYQRTWVEECFAHGADIVLGAHPHVLQPMASKTVKDMDGVVKERFVAYSLGNLISKRMMKFSQTLNGMTLNLTITKEDQPKGTSIGRVDYWPTWSYARQDKGRTVSYMVLPISKYLNNKQAELPAQVKTALKDAWADTTTRLGGKPR